MSYSFRAYVGKPLSAFTGATFAVALITKVAVIVIGISFLSLAFHSLYFGDMRGWHEVTAIVTGSDEVMDNPVVYTPKLSYQVDGKTYSGMGTQATKQQYEAGDHMKILVNPQDPTDIYQRDAKGQSSFMIGVGTVALMLPFILLAFRTIRELVLIMLNN
jgi:hypothetical protein